VTLLHEWLPESVGRILEFTATMLGLIIAGYAALAVSKLALVSMERGTTSFTPTRTPLFVPQSLVALGLILLTAQFVARLFRWVLRAPLDPGGAKLDAARDQ
jgi:TRAP-type C4-dicarboxylate transport system permease small subunit